MKLAVVGDTRHHVDHEGRLCTHDGVASQLEQWASLFDELVLAVPIHPGPPPPGFRPYRCANVSLRPLRPAGGGTLRAKAGVVRRLPGWWRTVVRSIDEADAVHLRCPCNVGLVGIAACLTRPRRHRYALYAGNWHGYDGEPWSYRLQRWALGRSRFGGLVTVYSDRPPAAPHVVPFFSPSFSLEDWDAESSLVDSRLADLQRETFQLVTVGSLTANKRHADVIHALRLLVDKGLDVRLDIVGDGPLAPDLAAFARELAVEQRVQLWGALDREAVRGRYREAAVHIVASRTEGYPKVVVEGMVAGAVPVVSEFPMARALVGGGDRGLRFEAGDVVALADRVAELYASPDTRAAMIANGRAYARTVTLQSYRDQLAAHLRERWGVPLDGPRPLRVLHVVDTLRRGGQERMAVEIANLLDPAEFDVTVCATREGGPLAADVRPGVDLRLLQRRSIADLRGLVRFLRLSRRFDIVHTHGSGPARMVALCRMLRLVGSHHLFHDHAAVGYTRPARTTRAVLRRGVDAYLGPAAENGAWAATALGMQPDRVTVLPNGIDLARFAAPTASVRTELGIGDDDVLLVMVAGFRPPKDHPTILRALARSTHRPRPRLLLVGGRFDAHADYFDRCRAMVDALGLEHTVKVVDAGIDVPGALASADAGVLSSTHESGPLVLAEYMAAGLPYVVTDTGELTRTVKGSGTGWVVPPSDPDALAAAIDEVAAMPRAERREMGRRGRALAQELFDQRRVVESVAEIYRGLAGRVAGGQ